MEPPDLEDALRYWPAAMFEHYKYQEATNWKEKGGVWSKKLQEWAYDEAHYRDFRESRSELVEYRSRLASEAGKDPKYKYLDPTELERYIQYRCDMSNWIMRKNGIEHEKRRIREKGGIPPISYEENIPPPVNPVTGTVEVAAANEVASDKDETEVELKPPAVEPQDRDARAKNRGHLIRGGRTWR